MATRSTPPGAQSAPDYTIPFVTVTALFAIFGFLASLNNTLVAKLEETFQLTHGPAMLAPGVWFLAYLVFSVPAAKLIGRVGYKQTMVISLFVMVVGALLFVPAAMAVSFPLTLVAIFVLSSGVCALQTSANPYISILGPESSAPARLTLAQAFNSLGSLIAPWIAAHFILSNTLHLASASAQASRLERPYIAVAATLFLLALAVLFTHLPVISATRVFRPGSPGDPILTRSIWRYPHTVLGMVGIFFYVGVEIALASITIQFCLAQGISSVQIAGDMLVLYYVFMMIGRFLGSFVMRWIKAEKLLVYLGLLGVVLLLVSMFTHGPVAIWSLVLCGIANSVMYPNIFALGIAELGPLTSKGSGVVTLGNVGGAVIPLAFGALADKVGIQYAYIIPIIGFIYVAYYGFSGYKPYRSA
jgi:FHS family L-fucose permease-like MFS transporter